MNEAHDEHIQKILENNLDAVSSGQSLQFEKDLTLYKLVFDELKKVPVEVPSHLHVSLLKKLKSREAHRGTLLFYTVLLLCIGIFLSGIYVVLAAMDKEYVVGFFTAFFAYKWVIVFSFCCFLLIQQLDQIVIKQKAVNCRVELP